jgi:hypothetical protein
VPSPPPVANVPTKDEHGEAQERRDTEGWVERKGVDGVSHVTPSVTFEGIVPPRIPLVIEILDCHPALGDS